MDEDLWRVIGLAVRQADRSIPRVGRKRPYPDRLIVLMYFWAVWHDRPLCWACRRNVYNRLLRPRHLPSVSQFCKRLRGPRVAAVIARVHEMLCGADEPVTLAFIDGKALPVSESSADPHAKTGRGNGRFSRGYKLHALGDTLGRIRDFRVRPMNDSELTVARTQLVSRVPEGCLVLADGGYDAKPLYTAVADRNASLLTPQKKNARSDAAMRRTCAPRRTAMLRWRDEPEQTRRVYAQRGAIERIFSALTCAAGGLGPLPAWVRTLPRVTRWVTAKVALYNARVLLRFAPS